MGALVASGDRTEGETIGPYKTAICRAPWSRPTAYQERAKIDFRVSWAYGLTIQSCFDILCTTNN